MGRGGGWAVKRKCYSLSVLWPRTVSILTQIPFCVCFCLYQAWMGGPFPSAILLAVFYTTCPVSTCICGHSFWVSLSRSTSDWYAPSLKHRKPFYLERLYAEGWFVALAGENGLPYMMLNIFALLLLPVPSKRLHEVTDSWVNISKVVFILSMRILSGEHDT